MNEYFDKVKNYLLTMDGDSFVDIWNKYRTKEMYKIYPSYLLDEIRDENDFYTLDLFKLFYKSCIENKFFNQNDDYFVFDEEDFVLYSAKKAVNLITSEQLLKMVNYILDRSECFGDEYLLEIVNKNYDKKQEENRMKIENLKTVNKVVSKIYVVDNGYNKAVAEVIKNPGCGFDYLIRIDENNKYELNVFSECLRLCSINCDGLEKEIIDKSFNDGYFYGHENIAIICDEII